MARPRKNPDDPKWTQNVGTSEQIPTVCNDWKMYFAALILNEAWVQRIEVGVTDLA